MFKYSLTRAIERTLRVFLIRRGYIVKNPIEEHIDRTHYINKALQYGFNTCKYNEELKLPSCGDLIELRNKVNSGKVKMTNSEMSAVILEWEKKHL